MQYHSMDRAHKWLVNFISRNKKASFRRLFNLLRQRSDLAIFGDYTLISEVITTGKSMGMSFAKKDVVRVCRRSNEVELQKLRSTSEMITKLTEVSTL